MAYAQVTRAQLRGYLQNRLDLAAAVFWREDEFNRYLNLSIRMFNALTGYWKTRKTITGVSGTVANQVWYSLPGTLTSSMKVMWNGKPLSLTSITDLDRGQYKWESETTADGGDVPDEPKLWAPAGVNLIAIWPADAAGGNSLMADGIATAPVLTADTDYLNLGKEELNTLLDFAQHLCVFKEGGLEFQASESLLKSFLKSCAARNGMLMNSAIFRASLGYNRAEDDDPRMSPAERLGAR